MHKIDTLTAGENNTFVDSDPTATPPVEGTDLNAAWFNAIQNELCNIITGFGGSLDDSEGYQNDSQILDVLQRIGIKSGIWGTGTNNGKDVDTSIFKTSHVIFHKAEDFTIGTLKTGSVVIVIPYWGGSDSPASINVDYTSSSYQFAVKKGQMLIGVVGNGSAAYNGAQIVARYMPIMLNPDGDIVVRGILANEVVATNVKATNRFETNFVQFAATEDPSVEGLQDWQTWQLAENWTVGQVKRVYCTDAQSSGTGVYVYYNGTGSSRSVKFYPFSYREFACVGTFTNVNGDTFAVLLVNGNAS